ncbi:disease resistance protein RPV1-like isoform X2 [Prosopis cineraria]|nr:disease resistance protein RPV1-like isoform X2 [Prosopis cineraria]
MLGIYGTGGIGKTTLAKALYNSIFYQFDGASFLFDVREASKQYRGIIRLQQTLLSEILEEKRMKLGSVDEGISKIIHRLSCKRILLVLDDVDEVEQLELLAGSCHWFGPGSKIIITTRNIQLLTAHRVETYEMKNLNDHDSLELFCWHAFHMRQPPKAYEDMSIHVIDYAQGLPLALRVIGSNLASKSLDEWRSTMEQYERIPERTIHEVLKISYDCLQDNAKCIFLDIACFFKKRRLEYVEEILDACDFGARFYIEVLVDKSLVTINDSGSLWMHDLMQEMGREIVRQEAPLNPSQRSRLWYHEDVIRVLSENSGSSKIEGIMLWPPQQEEVEWTGHAFEKMENLRILIVRNARFTTGPKHLPNNLRVLDWEGYPSMTLPRDFYPLKIVVLRLCRSHVRLGEPFMRFEYVTNMYFSQCEFITEVPDMSQVPNLRELIFRDCCNLIKVHHSVGSLSKLVQLDVSGCTKLNSFPHEIKMASLKSLDLSNCKSLDYFPNIVGKMGALRTILAENTAINELPDSIGNLSGLQLLDMNSCKSLRELPISLFKLQSLSWLLLGDSRPRCKRSLKILMQESYPIMRCTNLEILNLENCCLSDEDLHLTLNRFQNLQELILSGNDIVALPECIKECANLLKLEVTNCKQLRYVPEFSSKLMIIEADHCTSLTTESSCRLWSQVRKEVNGLLINMPASAFPDWFDHCYKGGTLSFRARGNFPRVAIAIELRNVNASVPSKSKGELEINVKPWKYISGCISINGRKVEGGREAKNNLVQQPVREGHVALFDLSQHFGEKGCKIHDGFMERDWNDVEIEFKCGSPNLSIVNCGIYVYKQQTNVENVQFKSSLLSINAPRTLLKRKAIASPSYESTKKFTRNFKTTDKPKLHNLKTRTMREES